MLWFLYQVFFREAIKSFYTVHHGRIFCQTNKSSKDIVQCSCSMNTIMTAYVCLFATVWNNLEPNMIVYLKHILIF